MIRFPANTKDFSLHIIQVASGVHPASGLRVLGNIFLGLNQPGHVADHSLPAIVCLKNFMTRCLINHGDNLNLPYSGIERNVLGAAH
jgi:hypothetical protein